MRYLNYALPMLALCLFYDSAGASSLTDQVERADMLARGEKPKQRVHETTVATRTAAQSGKMVITCQADAELWVDGVRSTQTGTERIYTTDPITECGTYTIKCRVCYGNSCKIITKDVAVTPGGTTSITLWSNPYEASRTAQTSGCTCGPNCPAGGNCQMGECGLAGCRPAGFKATTLAPSTLCTTCAPAVGYGMPSYGFVGGNCINGSCGVQMAGYGWPVGYQGGGDCASCSGGGGPGVSACGPGGCGGGGGRGLLGRRR